MRLPRELRGLMYDYAMRAEGEYTTRMRRGPQTGRRNQFGLERTTGSGTRHRSRFNLPLLRVCRDVSKEAKRHLYRNGEFLFDKSHTLKITYRPDRLRAPRTRVAFSYLRFACDLHHLPIDQGQHFIATAAQVAGWT
ncbi:hypothetical protein PSPO01_00318 [Paraphaeosphaeria sporulosa]